MTATKLQIIARERAHMGVITSLADFEWAAAQDLDAEILLTNPDFSLYCLDNERRHAVFTALPTGIDLSRVPFMYQAQFDHAEYLVALPYCEFVQLAEQIPAISSKLLCLHNIGRCGSTVLARALNEIDGLMSLSEPDVLTNFVSLRPLPRQEQIDLLLACLRWLCRPAIVRDHDHIVIKFRNQAAGIMDLYLDALPKARHLFIYRNAIDWLASFHRLHVKRAAPPLRYSRQQVIEQQASYYQLPQAEIEQITPALIESYRGLEGRAVGWLLMLGRYLEPYESGADIAAIRYEDLHGKREATLNRVLPEMDLPEDALTQALRAFNSDAQAGTKLARDAGRGNTLTLPEPQQATVRELFALQKVINRADYILPGIIEVE